MGGLSNRDGLGATPAVLQRRLISLLQRGLISVVEDDESAQERFVALPALEGFFADPWRFRLGDLYYRLTEKGADYWETRFHPRWEAFYRTKYRVVTREIQVIWLQCGSRELRDSLVLDCFEWLSLDRKHGLQRMKHGSTSSWWPVYWKHLSKCFYVRFTGREAQPTYIRTVQRRHEAARKRGGGRGLRTERSTPDHSTLHD